MSHQPTNLNAFTREELKKINELMQEARVDFDFEALTVVANLLRLNVPPDEIHAVMNQISTNCGLLKRVKLKPRGTQKPRTDNE